MAKANGKRRRKASFACKAKGCRFKGTGPSAMHQHYVEKPAHQPIYMRNGDLPTVRRATREKSLRPVRARLGLLRFCTTCGVPRVRGGAFCGGCGRGHVNA